MAELIQHGEPSSPSRKAVLEHHREELNESDDEGMGLSDLLPEPESPVIPPFSFAAYTMPEDLDLDLDLGRPSGVGRDQLILRLVGSHPLWGHHLWNTARTTSTYLLRHPTLYRSRSILELGAGAALPSLVCALDGAGRVVITDYPDEGLVQNMRWNAECNLPREVLERVQVEGHLWGAKPDKLLGLSGSDSGQGQGATDAGGYDLLILSDLVFNHSQHAALVKSVNSLISPSPSACILVFITHHRPHLLEADLNFFNVLKASAPGYINSSSTSEPDPAIAASEGETWTWEVEKVLEEWTGVMFDEDRGDAAVRGTVHGFKAWRRGRQSILAH